MKKGFSVAEGMIALLIGSVALGMAAPMITKQIKQQNFQDAQYRILSQQLVPSGAIMFFDRADCPDGWTALNSEGAFIRDVGGDAAERGVIQEGGIPNLKGWVTAGNNQAGDGTLFKVTSTYAGASKKGSSDLSVDFDASRYSSVYKNDLKDNP